MEAVEKAVPEEHLKHFEGNVAIETKETSKFSCDECGLTMPYDYFGNQPPFLKSFVTLEEAYLMKDPFSSDIGVIVLGSHCSLCHKPVCVSVDCSVFYTRRFCLPCVQGNLEEFPQEIKTELLNRKKKQETQ